MSLSELLDKEELGMDSQVRFLGILEARCEGDVHATKRHTVSHTGEPASP